MFKAYSDGNSVSFERVPDDYQGQEGEQLFTDAPTPEDLAAAFPAAILAAAILDRCAEVDALRDAHFTAGMLYAETGKVLQLGETDQQRIIAAGATAKFALMQATISQTPPAWPPQGFGWIMADNTVLPLDAAGVSAMADAAAAKVQAWIFNGYQHKQALRALGDAAAVAAYDISTGW